MERSRRLYDRLLPFAPYNVILGNSAVYCGPVARHLGLLAESLGMYGTAGKHFEDATAMNRRMNSPTFLVYSLMEHGAMLLRHEPESNERAVALIEDGLSIARKLGMRKAVGDGEQLLAGRRTGR